MSLALIALVTIGFTATVTAQTDNLSDDSDVNVTVSAETSVDMDPESLVYGDVFPGDAQLEDDNNITRVQVENVGSNPVDRVYMSADTPTSNGFGTGDATNYLSSNFLEINVSDNAGFNFGGSINAYDYPVFVNRKEYAEINDLSYIFVEDEASWEYGRFRVGENEYFWALRNTTDISGTTDTVIRVGRTAHNQSSTGTQDFTNGGDGSRYDEYTITDTGTNTDIGTATNVLVGNNGEDITATAANHREYDLVVKTSTTGNGVYVVRSRFDTNSEGVDLSTGGASNYIFDSASGDRLQPGDSFQVGTSVRVPRGVAAGEVANGLLTVTVESDA